MKPLRIKAWAVICISTGEIVPNRHDAARRALYGERDGARKDVLGHKQGMSPRGTEDWPTDLRVVAVDVVVTASKRAKKARGRG